MRLKDLQYDSLEPFVFLVGQTLFFFTVQEHTGLGKRVVLRLRESRLLTPSGRGREFTHPRDHSFAQPCICTWPQLVGAPREISHNITGMVLHIVSVGALHWS